MRLPIQSTGPIRSMTGPSAALEHDRQVLPQLLRFRTRFPEDPFCYHRCRANGGGDLICRVFCGLRPFTIGGLLIARRTRF